MEDVARQADVGLPTVWRWQQRSADGGVKGLLREPNRKPGRN